MIAMPTSSPGTPTIEGVICSWSQSGELTVVVLPTFDICVWRSKLDSSTSPSAPCLRLTTYACRRCHRRFFILSDFVPSASACLLARSRACHNYSYFLACSSLLLCYAVQSSGPRYVTYLTYTTYTRYMTYLINIQRTQPSCRRA
jgi:hypothetical protein